MIDRKIAVEMELLIGYAIFLIAPDPVECRMIEIRCPSHCRCDYVGNYRRADCSHQKLVMVESYIPLQTELLDISYNQISDLPDRIFQEQKLTTIQLLNVSHNKIGQIHMNAFEGLTQLKTLDLSYNAMQYVLGHWFRHLVSLQELYMNGNRFGRLGNGPLFESKTLRIFELNNCGLSYVGVGAFDRLPMLDMLDVSGNYLIQLNYRVISSMANLSVLKVEGNPFSCNNIMDELAVYCESKRINYENPCAVSKKIEKFQKMVRDEDVKNSWIFDERPENSNTSGITQLCTDTTKEENFLMDIIELSPVATIAVVLVYGITIGIFIGCSLTRREKYTIRKRRKVKKESKIKDESDEILVMSEWNIYESTPMPQRKL